MKKFTVFLLCSAVFVLSAAPVKISVKGEAAAAIIVNENDHRVIQTAARELQNYFRKITTARLPIRHTIQNWRTTSIVLGTIDSPLVKPLIKNDKNVKKLKYDGYGVRVSGKKMVIYSKTPRGVLNGVHRFIHNHTDFIWVRPLKELAIHSVLPDLTLQVKNHLDNPVFRVRAWSANNNIAYHSEEFELYLSRLCNNLTPHPHPASIGRQLDQGFLMEYGRGHNMSRIWLPKTVFGKTNPEFYMFNNGERRTAGRLQLCYSNRKMWDAYVKNSLKVISTLPKYYARVNMLIDDVNTVCDCTECRKPIKLPDGKMITVEDEAFRSTQFFIFMNYVAEKVYQKYPELEIKVYGYFFTAIPPKVKIFKNIVVSFCPYVRNDKETLHGKSNAKWLARTKRYAAMCPNVIWREYYYCFQKFPRAQANVIAEDLRFISKLGIIMTFPELSQADRPGWPRKGDKDFTENDFFTIVGPEFWTINQLYWNPHQDADALRNEYIKRTYRDGAAGVQKFYKILRDSWLLDPTPAAFNDNFKRDMGYYVVGKKLVEPCRAALNEAAETAKEASSKERIALLRNVFEKWVKCADSVQSVSQNVPKVDVREVPGFDFESGVWQKAATLSAFTRMGRKDMPAPEPTEVKIMHNGEKLYVGFRCIMPNEPIGKPASDKEVFPSGDHVEIFVANKDDGYYHLAFNFRGTKYDAITTNPEWNTKWDAKAEVRKGEWRGVAVVPLKSVKINVEQNNRVKATFYRCRAGKNGKHNVHTAWNGSQVHSVSSFGEIILQHE